MIFIVMKVESGVTIMENKLKNLEKKSSLALKVN